MVPVGQEGILTAIDRVVLDAAGLDSVWEGVGEI